MEPADLPAAAIAALRSGNASRAVELASELLRASPGSLPAMELLGAALQASGRNPEAVNVFEELTRIRPDRPADWMNLGTALRSTGELERALLAYANAAARGAGGPDFQFNVGLLHKERGDYPHAWRLLRSAHESAPQDAEIALQYAQCCYELLHVEEAAEAVAGWRNFPDASPEQVAQLALLLLNLGDAPGAQAALQIALQEPDPGPIALLHMCQIMERTNRIDQAQALLARLQADPQSRALGDELGLLDALLAQRSGKHEKAAAMLSAIASREEPHRRHIALFPLAKSQQSLRQYGAAWNTLEAAHTAQLQQLHRTHPEMAVHEEPPLLITQHSSDPQDFGSWRNEPGPPADQCPVFIVAFPRSGTTLLEQALDAHSGLVSMDEQPFLQQVVDRIETLGIRYPTELAKLSDSQLDALRSFYRELVHTKVRPGKGQRLVDKNPLNLLRLPVIRRLFPAAKVILAIRHPLDIVVSCYSQHFRAPEFALLCQDPGTLGRGLRRCMDFWYQQAAILGPDCLEVRYESLVADFEARMREIADFLAIPWQDAMLRPQEHAMRKGYISTPSYAQVVEPVNQRAVGKWQPYREFLAPAIEGVEPLLSRWAYTT